MLPLLVTAKRVVVAPFSKPTIPLMGEALPVSVFSPDVEQSTPPVTACVAILPSFEPRKTRPSLGRAQAEIQLPAQSGYEVAASACTCASAPPRPATQALPSAYEASASHSVLPGLVTGCQSTEP